MNLHGRKNNEPYMLEIVPLYRENYKVVSDC